MNLRRHHQPLAALFLAVWLLALFAGIASACEFEQDGDAVPTAGRMAMGAAHHGGHRAPAGCLKFCNEDTPLFSRLKLVQDLPALLPLLLPGDFPGTACIVAMAKPVACRAHPTPGGPLLLRTLRLAL
jgi:hypothetical protein